MLQDQLTITTATTRGTENSHVTEEDRVNLPEVTLQFAPNGLISLLFFNDTVTDPTYLNLSKICPVKH